MSCGNVSDVDPCGVGVELFFAEDRVEEQVKPSLGGYVEKLWLGDFVKVRPKNLFADTLLYPGPHKCKSKKLT